MTDSDQKQPAYVPVVATDGQAGGLYPAGTDAWSATPIIVLPSVGNLAAGLVPGPASWLNAQTLNALLHYYGKHIDAVADVPSFQWTPHAALQDIDLSIHGDTTKGNPNDAASGAALHYGGDGYFLMVAQHANTGGGGLFRTKPGQGLGIGGSADSAEWVLGGNAISAGSEVYSSATNGHVLSHAGSTGVACKVKISTNWGATWADAGIASDPGTGSAGFSSGGAFWNGDWYALDMRAGLGNYSTYLVKADDPTFAAGISSTWTSLGAIANHQGSFDQFDGRRVIANSTTLVVLPRFGNVFGYSDGTNFLSTALGAWSATPTGWRGAWNEQLGIFLAANRNGEAWASSDGITWALVFSGNEIYDVAPHGRGFVLSTFDFAAGGSTYTLAFLDQSPERAWRLRRCLETVLPIGSYADENPFHLAYGQGRVMAARFATPTAENVLAEIWTSGVNAYDRNNFVGAGA